jgi:hypothetical protein
MAHKVEMIHTSDADFNIWSKNLCQLTVLRTTGTPADWDHVPQAAVTTLTTSYADWFTAYAVTLKAHTYIETDTKNRARLSLTNESRSFINEYIRNSSKVSWAR